MRPKILLVDDREDNLISMEAILEPMQCTIVKARSGKEALKILLHEYDFSLILMDVKMPNLNGFETAALIYERERLKLIPIIFITAHNYDEEYVFRGYQAGAVDYIYKPINPELLRAKVSVFIELYKKSQILILQEQKLMEINKSLKNEINERKASEEKVRALNLEQLKNIDRLESVNKELDRFAFMASHDLQEPLRKIRTFSGLLSDSFTDILDERSKKYLSRIDSSAEQMQRLIRDILTFSKVSEPLNSFTMCDLNTVVPKVLLQLEDTMDKKQAKIVIEKLPKLMANTGLISLLFSNLISNALKYSKKDVVPVIRVTSDFKESLQDSGGNKELNQYCRVYIKDNGIGFEQKYAEQIFGMFQRLHPGEYEGTGVGLALCKKIVEQHNGYISAQSKVNEGATFIVSLPIAHPPAQTTATLPAEVVRDQMPLKY